MPSLLAEAMKRQGAMVATWTKLAQQRRPPSQLPEVGTRISQRQDSLFGPSYGDSPSEKYKFFRHWVYICVNAIADRVAGLAWEAAEITNASDNPERSFRHQRKKIQERVRQKSNSSQEIKSIASHPVLDLLARPNNLQRKYEFLYFTVANLEISGEAYWIIGKEDEGDKEQLFAVPSHWLKFNRKDKMYELRVSGSVEALPVPPEFVARTYFPNPSDPLSCYSPLNACLSAIRVDDYIQRSQSMAFERGIHPNLIVTLGPDPTTGKRPALTGFQRRQWLRAFREIWSQSVNQGDPAVVDAFIESVHKLHLTPQEMDWPASGEIVKKRITQTYRVNPYMFGEISGSNRAQAVEAKSQFNEQVINPLAGAISETATDFLGPRYETPKRLLVYLEQAVSEDPDQLLRTWATLRRNGDVTQDEIRSAVLGLAPLDQRDDPSNLTQLVGGFTGVLSLLQQVNYGLIGIDQAVALLTRYMRLAEEDAMAIIGKPVIRFQQPAQQQLSLPSPAAGGEEFEAAISALARKSAEVDEKAARRKAIEESRIKQYEETADSLESVLDEYFAGSVKRIVSGLGSGWTPDPENAESQAAKLLDENFDAELESTKLMEAAAAPLLAAFGKAVAQQREETKSIKRVKPHRTKKTRRKPTTAEQFVGKYDLDVPELSDIVEEFQISLRMPDWMVEQAFETLDDTFKRDYWREGIAPSTRRDVEQTLKAAIEEGLNSRDIADRLVEQHGRRYTQARATAVARTELGSMLNSGHSAGIEELAEETELDIRKLWLSALGSTTRESHAALHNTLADDDGMFELGGVRIPYPSHPDLPAEERINCLPADTILLAEATGATRAWYNGIVTEIITCSGWRLTLTPQHPVMTAQGFIAAGRLEPGQQVIAYCRQDDTAILSSSNCNDVQNEPASIEQVFEAFLSGADCGRSGKIEVRRRQVNDFYGDGEFLEGNIDVVLVNWKLLDDIETSSLKKCGDLVFAREPMHLSEKSGLCSSGLTGFRVDVSPSGIPRLTESSFDCGLLIGHIQPSGSLAIGVRSDADTSFLKSAIQHRSGNAALFGQLLQRHAVGVQLDEVIEIRNVYFAGHVYDLQTNQGLIVARDPHYTTRHGGLIVSNCQCTVISSIL